MSELLHLDVRTLAFVSSISGFLMAATMLGLFLAGMRARALVDWAIAGLAFGLGYLMGHVLQTIEVPIAPWVAGGTANALIGLGHGFILIGVQRYLGRKCWTVPIVTVVMAIFLSAFVVPELRESLRLRIIVQSGFYIVLAGTAGWLLWHTRRPGMLAFHRVAALVLLAFAAFLLVRFVYALFTPVLTTSFVQDPFQVGAFLGAMVFGICITMALAVMLFREKQVELMDVAEKDPLTGINNRLSLDHIAEREMRRADELNTPLSFMLLDIDHFKPVNDQYGHDAGDRVLREITNRINDVIRDSDIPFRFGGEEFIVLLPGAEANQAIRVAERLRKIIAASDYDIGTERVSLTASFGISQYRGSYDEWEDCLKRADEAMYEAKESGRNRVVGRDHIGRLR